MCGGRWGDFIAQVTSGSICVLTDDVVGVRMCPNDQTAMKSLTVSYVPVSSHEFPLSFRCESGCFLPQEVSF